VVGIVEWTLAPFGSSHPGVPFEGPGKLMLACIACPGSDFLDSKARVQEEILRLMHAHPENHLGRRTPKSLPETMPKGVIVGLLSELSQGRLPGHGRSVHEVPELNQCRTIQPGE
jgi:hypothetical protein